MGDRIDRLPARTEAQVPKALSKEQQSCHDHAVDLISSMALEPLPARQGMPGKTLRDRLTLNIDELRRNRVVLIDGARGSGKTSVLLSLLEGWSKRLEQPALDDKDPYGGRAIIPLPIIDLNALPQGANLAMTLLGRVRWIVDRLHGDDSSVHIDESGIGGFESGTFAFDERSMDLIQQWSELVAAMARWFGGADARRARISPEEFGLELSEEAHLSPGLDLKFRKFINNTVGELKHGLGSPFEPLLVAPIDDADMDPQRAAELLELLRAFFHPRLVFLLTGDTTLFLTSMRAHYLGSLWQPLHSAPAELRQVRAVGPGSYAVRLATEVYDRVIPPSHRCQVARVVQDLVPFDFADKGEPRDALELQLEDVKLYDQLPNTPDTRLLHLFEASISGHTAADLKSRSPSDRPGEVASDPSQGQLQGKVPGRFKRLRGALPDRFRDLVHLRRGLHHFETNGHDTPKAPDEQIERLLMWLWELAVHEETVYPRAKEQLLDVFRVIDSCTLNAGGAINSGSPLLTRRALFLACEHIEVHNEYRELHRYGTSAVGLTVALRSRARTRMQLWSDWGPRSAGDKFPPSLADECEPPVWLSRRTVATLKLAADVLSTRTLLPPPNSTEAIVGDTAVIGKRIAPSEFEGAHARVNYYSESLACNLRFAWRAPRWDAFLDFDLLADLWEYYSSRAITPEHLARVFAVLTLSVFYRLAPDDVLAEASKSADQPSSLERLLDIGVEGAWSAIAAAAELAMGSRFPWWNARRLTVFRHWRGEVLPSFGFPEAGLEPDEALTIKDVLLSQNDSFKDDRLIDRLEVERERHLRAVIASARQQPDRGGVESTLVEALIKELDSLWDGKRGERQAAPA